MNFVDSTVHSYRVGGFAYFHGAGIPRAEIFLPMSVLSDQLHLTICSIPPLNLVAYW